MKKQTAVEWLHYHLLHLMQTKEWRSKDLHIEKFDELFIEALTMEKRQIIAAYLEGRDDEDTAHLDETFERTYEDYYRETYGGEP
jgi:hypothetical protein